MKGVIIHRRERKGNKYLSLNNPLQSGYCGPGKVAGIRDSKKIWRSGLLWQVLPQTDLTYSQVYSLYN